MTKQTFSRETIRMAELALSERHEPEHVIDTVMDLLYQVNRADNRIRDHAEHVTRDMMELRRAVDSRLNVRLPSPGSSMYEIQAAVAEREFAFSTLTGLIGSAMLKNLLAMGE